MILTGSGRESRIGMLAIGKYINKLIYFSNVPTYLFYPLVRLLLVILFLKRYTRCPHIKFEMKYFRRVILEV